MFAGWTKGRIAFLAIGVVCVTIGAVLLIRAMI
ncbi:hypothetical protein ACI1US_01318 [Leucobacter sp. BZR 635]